MPRPIVVTVGDPAGIGPEVAVAALARMLSAGGPPVQLIITKPLLERTLNLLKGGAAPGPSLVRQIEVSLGNSLTLHEPSSSPADIVGQWSSAQAPFIRESLERGLALADRGANLVTGPTDKRFFLGEGMSFAGHTEYLAGRYPGHEPLMLFEAGSFRIAVMTRHIPLAQVTASVTRELLATSVKTASTYVKSQSNQPAPIAVAALDPHCGEWGAFSDVDLNVRDWIEKLSAGGIAVEGPLAADTLFVPHRLSKYGAILCWYHDQGMIPIKLLRFDSAVNVTLGLPILRVSPAHGVAYDIAWKGEADAGSFHAALCVAAEPVNKFETPVSIV
jgi:4-hydroxythreonine-4-phosphate dehydrogenase